MIEFLIPFEVATNFTQGQNIVTSSLVTPCIRGLHAELSELQEKYSCKLVRTLALEVNRRLSRYESIDIFKFSAALDPRWKLRWALQKKHLAFVFH